MTKIKRIFLLSILFVCVYIFVAWEIVQLNLEIKWIGIRHGTPPNLSLWAINYSDQPQEVNASFGDYFWIEDLMWLVTWHYTTIQCDGLIGPSSYLITGVYLMAWETSPIKILWNTGNVLISNSLATYYSIYNPIVYIYKPTNPINVGKANKYWDIPDIKIVIPPNAPAGSYNGTIVFSLYLN